MKHQKSPAPFRFGETPAERRDRLQDAQSEVTDARRARWVIIYSLLAVAAASVMLVFFIH